MPEHPSAPDTPPAPSSTPVTREAAERLPAVLVLDLEAHDGLAPEELAERALSSLLQESRNGPYGPENVRAKCGIPDDVPLEPALRAMAGRAVAAYRECAEECRERYAAQAAHCMETARCNGFPVTLRPVRIVLGDAFLRHAFADPDRSEVDNCYDPSTDTIFVQAGMPNRAVAHEMGHFLSRQEPQGEHVVDGFARVKITPKGVVRAGGNHWLNEGATMLWENVATNDGSLIDGVREGGAMEEYAWFRDMTAYLLHEAGIPEDVLLQAYFGDADARAFADARCAARFGTDLEGLGCLLQRGGRWAYDVLTGEERELMIFRNERAEWVEEKQRLARLFPYVRLVGPDDGVNGDAGKNHEFKNQVEHLR